MIAGYLNQTICLDQKNEIGKQIPDLPSTSSDHQT